MIQDIAPHIYHNEYRPEKPEGKSFAMGFQDGKLIVKVEGGEISYPRFEELEKKYPFIYESYTYLFCIDEDKFFLVDGINAEGYELYSKRHFREAKPRYLSFAGITAYQLYDWYQSRTFCGRCGHPMEHDGKERMMCCTNCGQMEFPKICPAVIIGIMNGNRLLLSKYAGREYTKYALIAGFAEIGETIEETVKREVMEEVGLKVKNITYYKSQPWSFTDTLLLGFYCEVDGNDEITLDEEELALAEWVERENIPDSNSKTSLTSEMMMNFKYKG